MYVEFNESEDASRDWELSVEFYPEELSEYEFFLYAAQGKVKVRSEVPREPQEARSKTPRSSF